MKYTEWQNCLEADGYIQQYPSMNPNALVDGASIDREVAEETPCPECGGKCEFHPFVAEGSYRALAACTACGEAYEF